VRLFDGAAGDAVFALLNDHGFTQQPAGIFADRCAGDRISRHSLAVFVRLQRSELALEYAGARGVSRAAIAFLVNA